MAPVWRFLTFTQKFGLNYGKTFTHSWSLCIEEQFYLVLPLAVLALAGTRRSPRLLWCALLAAIVAGMAARGIAFLDGKALSPGSVLNRLGIPGAAQVALWSYAVYLVHKPVFMALRPELQRRGIDPGAPLTVVAVMAAGIFGGWLLYRLVETPFMQLRARLYPAGAPKTRCADAPGSAGSALSGSSGAE